MWAPADLFTSGVNWVLFDLKAAVSYLYENPVVLAAGLVAAAGLIALFTALGNRRKGA